MEPIAFLKGFIIGFVMAAPVGPIWALCVRRTLAHGLRSGFLSGAGAAAADGLYGAVAAFGITAVAAFLTEQQFLLRAAGGVLLLAAGVRLMFAAPPHAHLPRHRGGLAGDFLSTFVLTLGNPMTALAFIAILATAGLGSRPGDYEHASLVVAGLTAGSACLWFVLCAAAELLRSRITPRAMLRINQITGLVVVAFGTFAVASAWVLP